MTTALVNENSMNLNDNKLDHPNNLRSLQPVSYSFYDDWNLLCMIFSEQSYYRLKQGVLS